jgi:hypothetical protein
MVGAACFYGSGAEMTRRPGRGLAGTEFDRDDQTRNAAFASLLRYAARYTGKAELVECV